ncbi:hypothetical protein N7493_011657 [Penicillium malachiteum]|uniref:Uncharacterized protein n=1 Tax=Penicillium malachiteum TaxID=1324776 RepID=A0AAD6MQ10_9EURO|nr:hypothetical protein N7493_011657 [Penicillium malachiteum]
MVIGPAAMWDHMYIPPIEVFDSLQLPSDLQVIAFLQSSHAAAEKWFQLYLGCNSVSPAMFPDQQQPPATALKGDRQATSPHDMDIPVPDGKDNEGKATIWPKIAAIQMAALIGLSSIVQLLENS